MEKIKKIAPENQFNISTVNLEDLLHILNTRKKRYENTEDKKYLRIRSRPKSSKILKCEKGRQFVNQMVLPQVHLRGVLNAFS